MVSILKLFLQSGLGCFFFGEEVSFEEQILKESLMKESSPEVWPCCCPGNESIQRGLN